MARLVYLGTPEIAVPPLRALVVAGHDLALVVSRPDRRRGRGTATSPSPVKAAALELSLPVSDQLADATGVNAELGVVVAYGRIIPNEILAELSMINLHFSLLPRWRGAAPVERAILAGDKVTGVCVMEVAEGLDTGGIYASRETPIAPGEHVGAVFDRLVGIGSELLVQTLADGLPLPPPTPQSGTPCYAEKLTSDDFALHWDRPAEELLRVIALDEAWTRFRGKRLRVLSAHAGGEDGEGPPGTLHAATVATGSGPLELEMVQIEGGRPMRAIDWLRGARPDVGEVLG